MKEKGMHMCSSQITQAETSTSIWGGLVSAFTRSKESDALLYEHCPWLCYRPTFNRGVLSSDFMNNTCRHRIHVEHLCMNAQGQCLCQQKSESGWQSTCFLPTGTVWSGCISGFFPLLHPPETNVPRLPGRLFPSALQPRCLPGRLEGWGGRVSRPQSPCHPSGLLYRDSWMHNAPGCKDARMNINIFSPKQYVMCWQNRSSEMPEAVGQVPLTEPHGSVGCRGRKPLLRTQ